MYAEVHMRSCRCTWAHVPRLVVSTMVLFGAAVPAAAQATGDQPLSRVLIDFLSASVRMSSGGPTGRGNPHEAHFFPGLSQRATPFELNKAIVSQLATFPLGSSSAGFTFYTDESTGALVPASPSFGPLFAERPLTAGRGRFNAGFNFQYIEFDSFEGQDLGNGDINFLMRHNDCCIAPTNNPGQVTDLTPFFEGDLVEARLTMNLKANRFSAFANFGVTDRLDVGIVVPIVTVSLKTSGAASILRLSTGVPGPTDSDPEHIHSWDGQGQRVRNIAETGGTATGLGDILLQTKWNFVRVSSGGLAAGLQVRLPTGDEDNLLGTGATQGKLLFIGSAAAGRFEPHFNVGYTLSSGELSNEVTHIVVQRFGTAMTNPPQTVLETLQPPPVDLSVPDEFNYVGGFDLVASSHVTASVDVVGRVLRDVTRLARSPSSFDYLDRTGARRTATFDEMNTTNSDSLHLALLAVGGKINLGGKLLLNLNVLFPITDDGLKPKPTPLIGLDYVF